MPKSCKILKNKKVIKSVIDLFRDGSKLTARDVSGALDPIYPILNLTVQRVHRILLMLYRRGIIDRQYDKNFNYYRYRMVDRSVLFDLTV